MSLRLVLTLSFSLLGLLVVLAGGALIVITTVLHRTAASLQAEMDGARIAESMEFALIAHERTENGGTRASSAAALRQMSTEIRRYAADASEHRLVDDVIHQIDAYLPSTLHLVGPEAGPGSEDRSEAFKAALASVRSLRGMNVDQSRSQLAVVLRWDRRANVLGVSLAVATLLGVTGVLLWLRSSVFRPALELSQVMDRYAGGQRTIRAHEGGPTELRAMARRFNEMVAELARRDQSQLAFLAGVAHDLRNPLGALKLASDTLDPVHPLPPETQIRQALARVKRQVDRLDRMLWDLLDASRIEAGWLELRTEECDVRELARAMVDLFAPTAPLHRLALHLPSLPVLVRCDPMRLEQVLTNLVSNAIKYSPRGGCVDVSVIQGSGEVTVSVSDQGIGISPGEAERLFEPFRRAGVSTESIPGVGLGLFVARRIMEAHGGRIDVEGARGRGSTFRAHLAAAPAERFPPALPAARTASSLLPTD